MTVHRVLGLHLSGEQSGPCPSRSGRHLGILVEDRETTRATLEAAGCTVERARPLPNRDRFFTRDPFGNRVELLAWTDSREAPG